jgi:pimeloyl-ACP methyl ester carboxylesterase
MRGYGRSPTVPGEFSHVEDLFELAKALKIKSPTLIGSSKGGTIALDFILQHPKFSAGLVMIGSEPSGFQFAGEPPPQWEPLVTAFKAGNFEKAAELEVEIWVVGPQRSPEQVDPEIRQLVKEMDLIALRNEALGGMEEQPPAETAVDQLEGVNVPTLVLFGELDDPNVLRAAGRMVASIPGVQSAAFPKAAHFPNLEEPKRFNQILEDFLASI